MLSNTVLRGATHAEEISDRVSGCRRYQEAFSRGVALQCRCIYDDHVLGAKLHLSVRSGAFANHLTPIKI